VVGNSGVQYVPISVNAGGEETIIKNNDFCNVIPDASPLIKALFKGVGCKFIDNTLDFPIPYLAYCYNTPFDFYCKGFDCTCTRGIVRFHSSVTDVNYGMTFKDCTFNSDSFFESPNTSAKEVLTIENCTFKGKSVNGEGFMLIYGSSDINIKHSEFIFEASKIGIIVYRHGDGFMPDGKTPKRSSIVFISNKVVVGEGSGIVFHPYAKDNEFTKVIIKNH
jgi:hypothetical protein